MGNDYGCSCYPATYKRDPRSIVVDLSHDNKQPHITGNKKHSQQHSPHLHDASPKQHLLVNNNNNNNNSIHSG